MTLKRIALLLQMGTNFSLGLFRGIRRYARPGRPWLFRQVPPDFSPLARLKQWQPDGIIAYVPSELSATEMAALDVPAVNCSGITDQNLIPSVLQDDRAIGMLAAEHFLERGFRNYAFFGDWAAYSHRRQEAFAHHLAQHVDGGFACEVYTDRAGSNSSSQGSWERFDAEVGRWLGQLPKPTALFCSNDWRALFVSEMCRHLEIRVPDQVAIMGVDDDEVVCELASPPLSSVAMAGERMGYEAAALLERMMEQKAGGSAAREANEGPIWVPPLGVVARQSTDVLAMEDRDVAEAIRFIRENAQQDLRIPAVLRHVSMSRRTLELRFRRILGRTPQAEIRRLRIARARELLAQTDVKMPEVARRSGFSSPQRLSIVFHRETGLTPTEYRYQFRLK